MNRYPLWKYILVVITILVACLYTLPNFFGETPAVQVSTNRQSLNVESLQQPIANALQSNGISHNDMFVADGSLKVRFSDEETQLKARDIIEKTAGDGYITALNLIPDSPAWLAKIRANPMFLGLDLRGGVHFLMQVDMDAALQKKLDSFAGDIRRSLRTEKIRNSGVTQNGNTLSVSFQDPTTTANALKVLQKNLFDAEIAQPDEKTLVVSIPNRALMQIREEAVKQNINTLHNRVNELGVAEPVIQQAGSDRIVVQLPGIQDTARAKDIIGRTATLELHMVADDSLLQQALAGVVPTGYELLYEAGENPVPVLVSTQVELTGDSINSAQQDFDENGAPAVALRLNNQGAAIFGDLTRANVGKRMAMVLIDQGKKEVVTAPVIRTAITGGRVQISGAMNVAQAIDTALLLRSGSLAAPMEIIEERTIGPSLGRENIQKGFRSTLWGFVAVTIFMMIYYRMFGVFSVIALTSNLLFLIAILSALQATLTLPGIAAIALTLGMAIDANVLINERIREELRDGQPPQMAINKGYEFAWGTIVDSNITSLIAGLALLIFGSGPVRGFAVVHCIGILTSMYSAVVVSRSLANLWYGSRHKLKSISIGTVYQPKATQE
ncbi:MAG: protein translocase subunit SecD [Neisseriaceae bacterium]|nr:protein translocase subunit SecD [Neisseriaceae bacterium]